MFKPLWQAIGCQNSIPWAPLNARFFSVCRVNQQVPKTPEARREAMDKYNQDRRLKYKNDEDYRQQILVYRRQWYDQNREFALQYGQQRYKADEDFRQLKLERAHRHYQKHKGDVRYTMKSNIHKWVSRHPEWVSDLPWKTHRPSLSPEPVEHLCEGCGYVRYGGMKVWWISKDEPDKYKCHSCYVQDVDQAMPAGYEGITRYKDLVARKKELDRLEKKPSP